MSTILLVLALASAAEPVAEPVAPTEALVSLGLDAPTPARDGGFRAALPTGGLVRWVVAKDEAAAIAAFEGLKLTSQSAVWPEAAPEGVVADQAVGDGASSVLLRKGLVVVYVRDLGGDAGGWANRVLPLVD